MAVMRCSRVRMRSSRAVTCPAAASTSASTERPRVSATSWRSTPIRVPLARLTVPVSGGSTPATIFSSVVLPVPLAPTKASRRPGRTWKATSENSVLGPCAFLMPLTVITAPRVGRQPPALPRTAT